ncbi:hypothetical protein [Peribacillus simplex]|uniref:hypothetical protein n=1 Tax=Peribacillus simplex TaxID=1478 RepID=UPI000F635A3B|nr:hypothetical protein [Peribacillus simplex]
MLFSFSKISASAILIGELKEHDTSETSPSFDNIFNWSLSFASITTDEGLAIFEIGRSLSMKGCPYGNVVAEATFKIIKTEFANQITAQLTLEFGDYVNCLISSEFVGI